MGKTDFGEAHDRFGTEEMLEAVIEAHGVNNPVSRLGMYVPTVHEVRTLGASDLEFILDCWMYESPVELIPRDHQIERVRSILVSRDDATSPGVESLIDMCDDYLEAGRE